MVILHEGDCLHVLKSLPDQSIDSIVTDPPYGLSFMGKKWDYDVPSIDIWREALRVLKPGGHVLSFAGTRTYHRMVVAIEDAGFEIRDQICWLYGSGFPKSLDVSKAIDATLLHGNSHSRSIKKANDSREGEGRIGASLPNNGMMSGERHANVVRDGAKTDEAKMWSGFGTALKPSHEPVVLARKPLIGTVAENVLTHGTGAMNIDDCRVEHVTVDGGSLATNPHLRSTINGGNGGHIISTETERRVVTPNLAGRFPANVITDGSDEVLEAFAVFGEKKAGVAIEPPSGKPKSQSIATNTLGREYGFGDSGTAARFFYAAKASKAERNGSKHPTIKPLSLMRYLCRLITPKGGIVLDPFAGSGTTGEAAIEEGFNVILIEQEAEYCRDIRRRLVLYMND
jgi:DNA modification methylase